MKILFTQNINGISGSELYLLQILPELKRRGYDVEMLLVYADKNNNNALFTTHLAKAGVVYHEIYGHNSLSPILLFKIYRLIKKSQYDIVQSNLIHADIWMAIIKLFLKWDLKIISTVHTYYPTYQAKYGYDFAYLKRDPYYWIQKFTSLLVNYTVTISCGLYNVYVEGGIAKKHKIKTIHYGLTLTEPLAKQSIAIPQGDYVLITGRLVGFKGHKYLIEAWKMVNAKYPSLKLCIAGDGELRSQLEKQVADAGLQDVILFMGHVPNPHPVMEHCLFTVVPSTWEGFGLILLESWLHKKPIVAFNVPAMNEVVSDGLNGLLVEKDNTNDLAEKIIYLFENSELITEFGENGFKKLNSYFTLKRMTDETEEVYQHICNNQLPV